MWMIEFAITERLKNHIMWHKTNTLNSGIIIAPGG